MEKTSRSIFWMTGMILAFEYLAVSITVIIFLIGFLVSLSLVNIEMGEWASISFVSVIFPLSLFIKIISVYYGVRYVFTQSLIQKNTVRRIIQWYVSAELALILIFSFLSDHMSFIYPGLSLLLGVFFIWYFFRRRLLFENTLLITSR